VVKAVTTAVADRRLPNNCSEAMTKRRRSTQADPRLRQLIAQSAATILAESGQRDFAAALCKATARHNVSDQRNLPNHLEIEAALLEHQRLFRGTSQPQFLQQIQQTALQAMDMFADFHPCLVGPVLNGTADQHSPVYLHLFADTAEEVLIFLLQQGVPFEQGERRVRYSNGTADVRPKFSFIAGEQEIQLTVFAPQDRRRSPQSPVDGKPMQRVNRSQLIKMLEEGQISAD
jgi:hypothetical protein